jgi:hypothetical protein
MIGEHHHVQDPGSNSAPGDYDCSEISGVNADNI